MKGGTHEKKKRRRGRKYMGGGESEKRKTGSNQTRPCRYTMFVGNRHSLSREGNISALRE